MKRPLRIIFTFLIVFIQYSSVAQSSADKLQAIYLYNFGKYIKWSREAPTFVIGIYGDSEMTIYLSKSVKDRKVNGKEIEIKEITTIEQIKECHIVYVSKGKSRQLDAINALTDGKGILVVTEEDLVRKGAGISFLIEDNTVKFKLNKTTLTKAGLIPSEGLLSLAIIVSDTGKVN